MIPGIEPLVRYRELKVALGDATGATEDLLHIHAGLLIFVISALVLRKRMRSPIPLALVVLFAAGNELIDWLSGVPSRPFEPLVDFFNTVFWPTILFLIARRFRDVSRAPGEAR